MDTSIHISQPAWPPTLTHKTIHKCFVDNLYIYSHFQKLWKHFHISVQERISLKKKKLNCGERKKRLFLAKFTYKATTGDTKRIGERENGKWQRRNQSVAMQHTVISLFCRTDWFTALEWQGIGAPCEKMVLDQKEGTEKHLAPALG